MNLRPLRPEHSALPNCATFRFFIYELVYLPVPQFGFNWKRLCFTRLVLPYRSLVLIGNGFVSLASCATFRFFIYELVYLPVPQFGFNWKRLCFTRLVHYIPIFTYELILETSRSVSQFGFIKNGSVFLAYCDYITISS